MIYLVKILDEIVIGDGVVKFYDGIDFDFINSYNKKELIVIFIDNWVNEEKKWKRECKINSLFGGKKYKKINNLYIQIYQTDGHLTAVFETIKKKMLMVHNEPYSAVTGFRGNMLF
jgi:hypothetical protein